MKDYVLEVETSQARCPDVIEQKQSNQSKMEPASSHGEKHSGKYVKFTIHSSQDSGAFSGRNLAMVVASVLFTCVMWHTLSRVDPLGKLFAMPSVATAVASVFPSPLVADAGAGTKTAPIGATTAQAALQLVYVVICGHVTEVLYSCMEREFEESLLIIPKLGVQSETILLTRSITRLYLRMLLLAVTAAWAAWAATSTAATRTAAASTASASTTTGTTSRGGLTGGLTGKLAAWDRALSLPSRKVLERQFVATEYVKDMVINEGFLGLQVIYYLALVVVDTEQKEESDRHEEEPEASDGAREGAREGTGNRLKVIVVFPKLLPRRRLVEAVWRRSRRFL